MFIEREASEDDNDEESHVSGELNEDQYKIEMEKAMKKTENRFRKIDNENEFV